MILRRHTQNGETDEQLSNLIANLPENNDHIANYILEHNGQLPSEPMFEKHPYLDDFELQDYQKYIIGTFPPISYIYDHPLMIDNHIRQNERPQIPAFHGNMNSMWQYFLNDGELEILNDLLFEELRYEAKDYIYERLNELSINYSDIIKNTRRKAYNANDDGLYNINPNLDLLLQILKNDNAKYLNFNSSTVFNVSKALINVNNYGALLGGNIKDYPNSFSLFLLTLQRLGFQLELSFNNQNYIVNQQNAVLLNMIFKAKVLIRLRISIDFLNLKNNEFKNVNKEFIIITTPSPSNGANTALVGNPVYQNWLQNQPNNIQNPTIKFRKHIYELFRNNHWEELEAMNLNF